MMMPKRTNKGFSILEYVVFLTILMGTLIAFKEPFLRALTGRWKALGDQNGYGRQFHPKDTVECAFDPRFTNAWYDVTCVENYNCPFANDGCEKKAIEKCVDVSFCKYNPQYDIN